MKRRVSSSIRLISYLPFLSLSICPSGTVDNNYAAMTPTLSVGLLVLLRRAYTNGVHHKYFVKQYSHYMPIEGTTAFSYRSAADQGYIT